ncbi:MAG: sodium-dependent transporter [Pirellulales bacterium]
MAKKERWASRLGLVLAMAGNAVGLGNFLRFPAQAAANGGGAFLIPYLVALLVMGIPLIWVEWAMGRYGGQHGHHSTPGIFQSMGRSRIWRYMGVFGLWTNLIIAAYYLYIESWTMSYAAYSLFGGFRETSPEVFFNEMTGTVKGQIVAISSWGLAAFFLCMFINVFILSRGLAKGIELICKVGMPLLILFGAILAVRGLLITPASDGATGLFVDPAAQASPFVGLNFVWQPKFDKLTNPAVWLAAAGQIFFTLSIGMGSIHCYASYLRETDDVALTGATAAWTNEFCEVILGSSILLPIAVAYLGLDKVTDLTQGGSGFNLGFMVFPTLFQKWGAIAPFAGFMWFGLLFFAAITSSLAMGQPIMSFLQTEFRLNRAASAWIFGLMLVPLAVPVACLHTTTFFDEFDHWAGTFALVVFALIEVILFAWVFGMNRGWKEIARGAEIKVPGIFYPIIKFVTPTFLSLILVGSFFQPAAGWDKHLAAFFTGKPAPEWKWAGASIIGKLTHADLEADREKKQLRADELTDRFERAAANADGVQPLSEAELDELKDLQLELPLVDKVKFWRNVDRVVLVLVFLGFSALVAIAWQRRAAEGIPDTLPESTT